MRVGIFADIHGNLAAFEAALEHTQRQHLDMLVIAGDIVVGSPDSAACWEMAKSLQCPILRGNHERYVAHFDRPDAPPSWRTEQFGPVRWAHQQLTPGQHAELEALPLHLRLESCPDLLIVHSSLRNDRDVLAAYTPEHEVAAMFPGITERVIVRGHNHVPALRLWNERTIVTSGAVGLALNMEPTAQYVILERRHNQWHVAHQSVPYDVDATIRRFTETGYLENAGPMARLLMREVATATGAMVPFLHAYEQWSAKEPIPLNRAIDRFWNQW